MKLTGSITYEILILIVLYLGLSKIHAQILKIIVIIDL